jgi:hypothetical protein
MPAAMDSRLRSPPDNPLIVRPPGSVPPTCKGNTIIRALLAAQSYSQQHGARANRNCLSLQLAMSSAGCENLGYLQ